MFELTQKDIDSKFFISESQIIFEYIKEILLELDPNLESELDEKFENHVNQCINS